MRVLFATTHTYPPQRTGGAWSSVHDLCVELGRRGIEAGVLSAEAPLRSGFLSVRNRAVRKIRPGSTFVEDRVMGYPAFRSRPPVEKQRIQEVVDRFRPSVVVVQVGQAVPLVEAFLNLGVPTALYLRDVEFHDLGGEIVPQPGLAFLANSAFTADRARERFGVEASVIPPMIRPERYTTETDRSKVVFVNPHPLKGSRIAFPLAESRPDVPFLFVESWDIGPDTRKGYQARARAAGNIQWRRRVADMRKTYAEAKLVLVPSMWEEAWCRVVSEAQLSGIPALASRRGGLPESVGPGGILVDPDAELEAWKEGLARLWDDAEEYNLLSEKALLHAQRPEIQPDNLVSAFIQALEGHVSACASRMQARTSTSVSD